MSEETFTVLVDTGVASGFFKPCQRDDAGKVELVHGCEVCYKMYGESELIKVEGIQHSRKRVFPWRICKTCAEKIRSALEREGE